MIFLVNLVEAAHEHLTIRWVGTSPLLGLVEEMFAGEQIPKYICEYHHHPPWLKRFMKTSSKVGLGALGWSAAKGLDDITGSPAVEVHGPVTREVHCVCWLWMTVMKTGPSEAA